METFEELREGVETVTAANLEAGNVLAFKNGNLPILALNKIKENGRIKYEAVIDENGGAFIFAPNARVQIVVKFVLC